MTQDISLFFEQTSEGSWHDARAFPWSDATAHCTSISTQMDRLDEIGRSGESNSIKCHLKVLLPLILTGTGLGARDRSRRWAGARNLLMLRQQLQT